MAFTPVWGTGFEMGALPLRAGKASESGAMLDTDAKTGTYSVRVGASYSSGSFSVSISSASDVSVGVWAKQHNGGSLQLRLVKANGDYIYLAASQAGSRWDLYEYIKSTDTTTLLASGTVAVTTTDYHNVQIYLNGTTVQTRVNGVIDISYAWTGTIVSVSFYGGGAAGGYGGNWDDISIGSGDWPGDIRYDVLTPTADTAVHSWMPNGVSLQTAPAAPTAGVTAGPGLTGDYRYKITLVDSDGETLGGTASTLVQPADQVVALSAIPTGLAGTTARKIYRTAAGGSVYKLAATISDNTTTTYNDSLADGSLGAEEPINVHYDKIDERPPSDTDYIYTATNGAQDLHELSDWDATKKRPLYLVHWTRVWKDTADTQSLDMLVKSGIGGALRTSSAHELLTSAAYEYEIHTTDPAGNAWTDAEIDALQVGVEAVVPA